MKITFLGLAVLVAVGLIVYAIVIATNHEGQQDNA
jgi:hypothetical protein